MPEFSPVHDNLPAMQYYSPSFTDFSLSRIALGCMSFHDLPSGRAVIESALDLGINFFDTADLYDQGVNEKVVGEVLRAQRQNVLIATKVGNRMRADGSGWDWAPSKKYILQAVEDSLRRLQTDYIDLYQLHGGTLDDPWEEIIEAFEHLKAVGKIRAYGISSIRPNVIRHWTNMARGSTCMTQYSLLDRRPEETTLAHLHQAGQYVLVRGALAKGLLAGKAAKGYLNWDEETIKTIQERLGLKAGKDLAGWALSFAFRPPAVGSVVLGASSPEQLQSAVHSWERLISVETDWSDVELVAPAQLYGQHR